MNKSQSSVHTYQQQNYALPNWLRSFYLAGTIYVLSPLLDFFLEIHSSSMKFEDAMLFFSRTMANVTTMCLELWIIYYFIYKQKWKIFLLFNIAIVSLFVLFNTPSMVRHFKESVSNYDPHSIITIRGTYDLILGAALIYYVVSSIRLYWTKTPPSKFSANKN